MLFTRLQSQCIAGFAVKIFRFTDNAPRHLANQFLRASEQADVRATEIEAVTDRLTFADSDVSAHLSRRRNEAE